MKNKSTNKKCKYCESEFIPIRFAQKCCSVNCAILYTRKINEDKDWAKRKKEIKEKLKSLSDYMAELQREVNHIARLIDYGQRCISSGKVAKKENGGHFYSVGSHPALRFNLHNVHLQSEYDNTYKHGNQNGYRSGLIERYGIEYVEMLDNLTIEFNRLKPTKDELIEAIKTAKVIVKEMKASCKVYSPQEALQKRNEVNARIGFYT